MSKERSAAVAGLLLALAIPLVAILAIMLILKSPKAASKRTTANAAIAVSAPLSEWMRRPSLRWSMARPYEPAPSRDTLEPTQEEHLA